MRASPSIEDLALPQVESRMLEVSKTWIVECYLPGADDADVRRAVDHAAVAVRALGGPDSGIEYLGALLMAVDEVVLHAFRAADPELVRRASTAAELVFERVIESVEVLPQSLVRPDGHSSAAPGYFREGSVTKGNRT